MRCLNLEMRPKTLLTGLLATEAVLALVRSADASVEEDEKSVFFLISTADLMTLFSLFSSSVLEVLLASLALPLVAVPLASCDFLICSSNCCESESCNKSQR